MQVREMGEQGLLERLQSYCSAEVVGDDAAVLTLRPGRSLVVTSDVLVDGVHFSDQTTRPEDAGWRAAAANLSDLAAMGATPLGITVGLGLPGDLGVEWVERLYQGLTDCLRAYQTGIVGGDVVRSPTITVAITAFGEVTPNQIIRRSQAQPGQTILATGWHGLSRAGLELLLHPDQANSLDPDDRAFLIQAHQRPKPRLDVLPWLWQILAQQGQETSAIAGMDSSDGLADAVIQICRASGVGAQLERTQIPIYPGFSPWISGKQAIDWALYGGEDFELVLCLQPDLAQQLVGNLGTGAAIVGTITSAPDVWLSDRNCVYPDQQLTLKQSFQHY